MANYSRIASKIDGLMGDEIKKHPSKSIVLFLSNQDKQQREDAMFFFAIPEDAEYEISYEKDNVHPDVLASHRDIKDGVIYYSRFEDNKPPEMFSIRRVYIKHITETDGAVTFTTKALDEGQTEYTYGITGALYPAYKVWFTEFK